MKESFNFFKYYLPSEIIKSFLTSLLFFIIPASVVAIMGVQTILVMIPDRYIVIPIMYGLMIGILFFSTKILIDTFKHYKVYKDFNYQILYWLFFMIIGIIITLAGMILILIFV
jgi:hypothetical protein